MMIKNIIWDFDGTLFDTYSAQSSLLSDILKKNFNIELDKKTIRRLTSISLGYAVKEISRMAERDMTEIEALLMENYSKLPLDLEYPFKYAKEICQTILSLKGKNLINTHRGKLRLLKLLNKYDMSSLFCDMITSEDGMPRKPDPMSFEVLIERNDLLIDETLVVGDRELDIIGGKNAGLRTYFFNSNKTKIPETVCDFVENDLKFIFSLIG